MDDIQYKQLLGKLRDWYSRHKGSIVDPSAAREINGILWPKPVVVRCPYLMGVPCRRGEYFCSQDEGYCYPDSSNTCHRRDEMGPNHRPIMTE